MLFERIPAVLRENPDMLAAPLREKVIYFCEKISGKIQDDESYDINEVIEFIRESFWEGRYKLSEIHWVAEIHKSLDLILGEATLNVEKERAGEQHENAMASN